MLFLLQLYLFPGSETGSEYADLHTLVLCQFSPQFSKIYIVSQWVVFKTALMVWKCVHGVAAAYLCDLIVPATAISGRQQLRSAATDTLLVPCIRTATGQRSFAVNGPATWNRLPPALQSPDLSESAFKRALKTHLFSTARRHWDIFMILALLTDLNKFWAFCKTVDVISGQMLCLPKLSPRILKINHDWT